MTIETTRSDLAAAFRRWKENPEEGAAEFWADQPIEAWAEASADTLIRHLNEMKGETE